MYASTPWAFSLLNELLRRLVNGHSLPSNRVQTEQVIALKRKAIVLAE